MLAQVKKIQKPKFTFFNKFYLYLKKVSDVIFSKRYKNK